MKTRAIWPIIALVLASFVAACRGPEPTAPPQPQHDGAVQGAAVQHLGLPDAANATPVLAASGHWVVAVWTATRNNVTNVYAATSTDDGGHFGAPARVNDTDGEAHVYGEDPPRVAIGRADPSLPNAIPDVLVTWPSIRAKRPGLRSARSTDGGRTFSASVSVGDPGIEGERGFQAVLLGNDHVARAVWLDQRRDPGTPHHANVEGDWDPMHLMFASATSDGRWAPETRLASNVCGCCKTAIARTPDGAVYIAFRNIYPGSMRDISFAVSRDGSSFASPVRISEDHWSLNGCPDDGPTMAIDEAGVAHVVWPTLVDGQEPAIRLFHAATRDGLTFTPRQAIQTLGTPKPAHAQMTVDACGRLVLVWDESQGKGRHVVAMRQLTPEASGAVREGETQIVSGEVPATYPVIAPVPGGVIVGWTEGPSQDKMTIAVRRVPPSAACAATQTARR